MEYADKENTPLRFTFERKLLIWLIVFTLAFAFKGQGQASTPTIVFLWKHGY